MNPLVSEMLFAQREDLELRNLEGLLEDDCKCESKHRDPENRYCSGGAAYVGMSCMPDIKICDAAGKAWMLFMEDGSICDECDRLCGDCWTIRPI